ncbi:gp638 [Bacillus phage G]|uniref:Gp638 n=1 Tax=Bacillus phage G TaxID=2884420 RepID=G3MB18_9CAUD|nr:gp638 [Bacillus phage G]AEO93882.1 gp638 [Bacillus phage G]
MITIQYMKPFYQKVSANGETLRLVFAFQYFSISKDQEIFHFIPIEGKEVIIDLKQRTIKNMSEVFVFQKGNRFIRLPLYQLALISNFDEMLSEFIDKHEPKINKIEVTREEASELMIQLENANIDNLIDIALDNKDEEAFYTLVAQKQKGE